MNAVRRAAAIVVIAVLAAPPIGGLAFYIFRSVQMIALGEFDDARELAIIITLGTYVVGGPIALVAGILVAAISHWRTPSLPIVLAAVVVGNLAVFWVQPFIGYGVGGFAINLGASLVSAFICWWLVRRLLTRTIRCRYAVRAGSLFLKISWSMLLGPGPAAVGTPGAPPATHGAPRAAAAPLELRSMTGMDHQCIRKEFAHVRAGSGFLHRALSRISA